jgi:hypothetical protein
MPPLKTGSRVVAVGLAAFLSVQSATQLQDHNSICEAKSPSAVVPATKANAWPARRDTFNTDAGRAVDYLLNHNNPMRDAARRAHETNFSHSGTISVEQHFHTNKAIERGYIGVPNDPIPGEYSPSGIDSDRGNSISVNFNVTDEPHVWKAQWNREIPEAR